MARWWESFVLSLILPYDMETQVQTGWLTQYMLVRSLSVSQAHGYVQKGHRRWNGCTSETSRGGPWSFCIYSVWATTCSEGWRLRPDRQAADWANAWRIATWLILPVVIRSSQRLSHACVSINLLLWNCEWLNISVVISSVFPYYLDNRSNSRANTCVNTLKAWYLLDRNQPTSVVFWWFIITLRIAWLLPAMDGLSFCPISFDGWVLASHGFHG